MFENKEILVHETGVVIMHQTSIVRFTVRYLLEAALLPAQNPRLSR